MQSPINELHKVKLNYIQFRAKMQLPINKLHRVT